MDPNPDDMTAADDLTLLQSARAGDRLAFGVLYLRHHAAAWRVACVASRFSPDAELAVIEGFTRVFSALPQESEEFDAGRVSFRPYLLACVRQSALDRARAAGRVEAGSEPAPLAGLAPDGEVVLSTLEHHVARGALAGLAERSRTALWLADVEAMTPGEIAGILGGPPEDAADLTARARVDVQAAQADALTGHEVRAGCRFTVDHLDAYEARALDPAKGVLVRSHLDVCPTCRMRLAERANAPAALAAAVPAAPLLGGETQHHWLTSAAEIRPAERLLPPGLAAAPAHRLPDVLRRRGRAGRMGRGAARTPRPQPGPVGVTVPSGPAGAPGWTGPPGWSGSPTPSLPPAWTIPPGRVTASPRPERRTGRRAVSAGSVLAVAGTVPALARQARSVLWPVLPAISLVVAWMAVMLALPQLMQPGTAPGPDGMALPAVQAYVPNYLPGAAPIRPTTHQSGRAGAPAGPSANATELAMFDAGLGRASAVSAVSAGARKAKPSVGLIPRAISRPSRPTSPPRPPIPAPNPVPSNSTTTAVVPAVGPAVVPVTSPTPDPTCADDSTKPAKKPKTHCKPDKEPKPRKDPVPRGPIVSA